MRLIDRKLTDIINGLVQTFPQEKMISLRRMIPGMAYKAYYAKPAAVEKDETIMEQSQVDVLCDYAHEQCKMCIDMKCSACPLGKVFDSILSDDRDGTELGGNGHHADGKRITKARTFAHLRRGGHDGKPTGRRKAARDLQPGYSETGTGQRHHEGSLQAGGTHGLAEKDRAYNVTRRLTGMPTAHGGESGLDATLAALSALTEDYGEKVRSYTREIRTAERILSEIPSETMRVFVRMFYVDNLPAAQVRRELHMSEYGFARARNAVEQAQDMNSVIWRERYMVDEKAENLSQNT